MKECWRLLKPDGAIFYNHKPRVQKGKLWTPLELNPGLPVRQIVIWDRGSGMNFNRAFYLPTHEYITIFAKAGFKLKPKCASFAKDIWSVPMEKKNKHPAPFPVALPKIAIESTDAAIILDPFMGSGSTGVAAIQCGREFIGIELAPQYIAQAVNRISAQIKQSVTPLLEAGGLAA